MPRRGIFGGSFDPIHAGHLAAARAVLGARRLERIYLVPAALPPHKESGCEASFADRVEMARRAAAGEEGLEVLPIEGEREGRSYTIDTVEALERRQPGVLWDLLVGADMLADLPRWRRAGELVRKVTVVAFARPGQDLGECRRLFAPLGEPVFVEVPPVDLSASEVRRRVREGRPIGGLVPAEVEAYIRRRGLYGSPRTGG